MADSDEDIVFEDNGDYIETNLITEEDLRSYRLHVAQEEGSKGAPLSEVLPAFELAKLIKKRRKVNEREKEIEKLKERKDKKKKKKSKSPPKVEKSDKRSRSRSRSKKQKTDRSQSRSKSREKKKQRSKSREKRKSRSKSREKKQRSKSRERRKSRSKSRDKKKPDSKSPDNKSRSKSRERRKSRSRSRERKKSRSKSRERKKSRSKSRERKKSRSKSRERKKSRSKSCERKKSRSKSHERKKSRSKSRERKRSRSRSRERKKSRSRSRARKRSRSRSRDRRRSHGRSSGKRRSRSRSRSRRRSPRRSRRRSRDRRRSRSRDRSRHHKSGHRSRRHKIWESRSRSRSRDKDDFIEKCRSVQHGPALAESRPIDRDKYRHRNQYSSSEESMEALPSTDKVLAIEGPEPTNAVAIFTNSIDTSTCATLPEKRALPPTLAQQLFPVSCGSEHKTEERGEPETLAITDGSEKKETEDDGEEKSDKPAPSLATIMQMRIDANKLLVKNPNDADAKKMFREAQLHMNKWQLSQKCPGGRFSGNKLLEPMSREEIDSDRAWAKKDMFFNLAPIQDSVGMSLMKRMGWSQGKGLGKDESGDVNPLQLTIKTDKRGLMNDGENLRKAKSDMNRHMSAGVNWLFPIINNKHAVSGLGELHQRIAKPCPEYTDFQDQTGITIRCKTAWGEFTPDVKSVNKKEAKGRSAMFAIQQIVRLEAEKYNQDVPKEGPSSCILCVQFLPVKSSSGLSQYNAHFTTLGQVSNPGGLDAEVQPPQPPPPLPLMPQGPPRPLMSSRPPQPLMQAGRYIPPPRFGGIPPFTPRPQGPPQPLMPTVKPPPPREPPPPSHPDVRPPPPSKPPPPSDPPPPPPPESLTFPNEVVQPWLPPNLRAAAASASGLTRNAESQKF